MNKVKICKICEIASSSANFRGRKCLSCIKMENKIYQQKRRQSMPDRIKEIDKKSKIKNAKQVAELKHNYYLKNKCSLNDNFKKCLSLENLRPLPAKQNVLDGARK